MKKIAPVAMALTLAVLLAVGCGSTTSSQTPSQVVKAFFDDIMRNDAAASFALISTADKKQIKAADWKTEVKKQADSVKSGGPVTVTVKSSKQTGGGAVVTVELKQRSDSQELNIVTEKEDGAWKLSLQQSEGLNAP